MLSQIKIRLYYLKVRKGIIVLRESLREFSGVQPWPVTAAWLMCVFLPLSVLPHQLLGGPAAHSPVPGHSGADGAARGNTPWRDAVPWGGGSSW